MAKGLFNVFSDDGSVAAPPPRSSHQRSKRTHTSKSTVSGLAQSGLGKENVDPINPFASAKKGKGKACSNGTVFGTPSCTPSRAESFARYATPAVYATPSRQSLANLADTTDLVLGSPASVYSYRSMSSRGSWSESDDDETEELERSQDLDSEPEVDPEFEEETVKFAPSQVQRESDDVLNRRARALTETPLAELTEAFNGSGNFALPASRSIHGSPTPASRMTASRNRSYSIHSNASTHSIRSQQSMRSVPPSPATSVKSLRF